MQDREINVNITEVPEIPEDLVENLLFALEEGKKVLCEAKHGESFAPFTARVVGEEVFMDPHAFDDADMCFDEAKELVKNTENCVSYAFCYDGFIDSENDSHDAIISEGGIPGTTEGHAIGQLYESSGSAEDGNLEFKFVGDVIYLGSSPNFLEDN